MIATEQRQTICRGGRAAWLLGVVVFGLCLVGCRSAAKPETARISPAIPKLLQQQRSLVAAEKRAVAALAPVAPKTLFAYWNNAPGATIAVVEWRHDLAQPWQSLRLTNVESWQLPDAQQVFVRVAHPNEPGHWWDGWQERYRQD